MDEELLEIHSKDFLIKWFHAADNLVIDWQVTPQKKLINFAIYRKVEDATLGVDIKDLVDHGSDDHSGRSRLELLLLVNRVTSLIYKLKQRLGTFNLLNSTDLTLVKNYYKLLGNETVHGKLEVQQGGVFAFVFDNSFSKTIAKKVLFSAVIELLTLLVAATPLVLNDDEGADASADQGFEHIGTQGLQKQGELLQGVLLKRKRKKLQGFTKRYFILLFKYGTLSYYKVGENKLRGQMPIKTLMISANQKNREIVIDSGMEIWDLRAQLNEEFNTWVDAFNQIKLKKDWARSLTALTQGVSEDGTQYVLDELEYIANKLEDLKDLTSERDPDVVGDVNDIYLDVLDLIDDIVDGTRGDASNVALVADEGDDVGRLGVVMLNGHHHLGLDYSSDEYSDDDYDDYDDQELLNSELLGYGRGLGPIDELDETQSQLDRTPSTSPSIEAAGVAAGAAAAGAAGAGAAAAGHHKAAHGKPAASEDEDHTLYPLPHDPVHRNPDIPACEHQPPSILGFVRKNIGKDLSTIAMPVDMNEPLTILQKFAEQFEYSDLVDNALDSHDDGERILRIAAFAVSGMSLQREKERNNRKPFNPLLGETFELVREDKGLRMILEKVLHRPPVFAYYAETSDWTFQYAPSPNQTFWGKNAEIVTNGTAKLTIRKTGEVFTWTSPLTLLKNIIAGEKYTEPSSELTVKSLKGYKAVCDFAKGGMFSGRLEDLTIKAFDGSKKELPYSVTGKWTELLTLKSSHTNTQIWHVGKVLQPPKKKFGFTEFAGTLNKITPIEDGKIAPTDSRLRPDMQVYEEGNVDKAEQLKVKLEEDQRTRRKQFEEEGKSYKPMFFEHVGAGGPDQGEWVYKTGHESYWNRRARGDWQGLIKLW